MAIFHRPGRVDERLSAIWLERTNRGNWSFGVFPYRRMRSVTISIGRPSGPCRIADRTHRRIIPPHAGASADRV
jgi:hypothetical protein